MSMTLWPRSWNWRSLRITTVNPRWMSGAVGSTPSLMFRGRPLASLARRSSSSMISRAPLAMVFHASRSDMPIPSGPGPFGPAPAKVKKSTFWPYSHGRLPLYQSLASGRGGELVRRPPVYRAPFHLPCRGGGPSGARTIHPEPGIRADGKHAMVPHRLAGDDSHRRVRPLAHVPHGSLGLGMVPSQSLPADRAPGLPSRQRTHSQGSGGG